MSKFISVEFQEMAMQTAKGAGDVAAVGITIGVLLSWLPYLAALLTIVWTGIRIWEMKTVRGWVKKIKLCKCKK